MISDQADKALIAALRDALAREADPAKAPQMQAYMRSEMPFYGVAAPPLRRICKTVFAEHPLQDFERRRATVLRLWREAHHREERYAAIALTGDRHCLGFQSLDALSIYEELIVTGAWWDYVDEVAIRRIGPLLKRHPTPMARTTRDWSRSEDLWKRRTAIICQVGFKDATTLELLDACIMANVQDRAFFIRKAIGWALRAYAWVDADWVIRYVAAHAAELSGLSRREALRNVLPPATRAPGLG